MQPIASNASAPLAQPAAVPTYNGPTPMNLRTAIFLCFAWFSAALLNAEAVNVAALKAEAEAELALRMIHGEGVDKRPAQGFDLLHKAAQTGHKQAMALYGTLVLDERRSRPTSQTLKQALTMLRRAARAESATAITTLARVHLDRRFESVRKEKEGERWLVRGIAAGHPGAARLAGRIYLGAGAASHDKARLWFTKTLNFYVRYSDRKLNAPSYAEQIDLRLAKQEAAEAALALARMHRAGLADLKRDKAMGWYRTSANLGSVEAMITLADSYLKNKKSQRAAEMLRRAAESGHAESMRRYGDLLREGRGTDRDPAAALNWYGKAIVAGDRAAMAASARMHYHGRGVPVNHKLSLRWATEAAKRKIIDGHHLLGLHHLHGKGTARAPARAFGHFLRAALHRHPAAMVELSRMYRTGLGVDRDESQAYRWARRSAQQDHPEGMELLGRYFEQGVGIAPQADQAFVWTHKAARAGRPEAMKRLSRMYEKGLGTQADPIEAIRWKRRYEVVAP